MGKKWCPHGKFKYNCKVCTPCPHGKVNNRVADCNPCPGPLYTSDAPHQPPRVLH